MSTIKVDSIKSSDGNTDLLTLSNGAVSGVSLGRRNLIINGSCQVAQRSTSETGVTSSGYQTCDRFKTSIYTLGTWTVDQSTDAPEGFSNSFKMTCTTADASPATGDYAAILYLIEAQDLQHLAYGTSSAKTMTLSFWVKSNVTGDASFTAYQDDNSSKTFGASYTINAADTWEHKTIVIPADTSGVINNDNGTGLQFNWIINSGSTYTAGSHQSTWATYATGNLNPSNLGVGGNLADYFAITGVQLEVGSVATPFEHRSYGEELALCQRYYQLTHHAYLSGNILWGVNYGANSNNVMYQYNFPVQMRDTPNVTVGNAGSGAGTQTTLYATNSGISLYYQSAGTSAVWLKDVTAEKEL